MDNLTPAQRRYLDRIRHAGTLVFNGRARRPIKALEAAGLVDVHWDHTPQASGSGIELVQTITVTARPVEPAEDTEHSD